MANINNQHEVDQRKYSNLYVSNLDEHIFTNDQQLFEKFECFGRILSAKV